MAVPNQKIQQVQFLNRPYQAKVPASYAGGPQGRF